MIALLAVGSGVLIGLSLGALGGGGSILAVPALVYLLGQPARQATTVSLIVVGVAAAIGALAHGRAGRVRLKEGAIFGLLGVAGSFAGSRASAAVPPDVLLAGFGALMLAVAAARTARRRAAQRGRMAPAAASTAASTAPVHAPAPVHASAPVQAAAPALTAAPVQVVAGPGRGAAGAGRSAAATGVGLITGFFGVGGGFVVVPALLLLLGFDMPTAAGTSLVVIAIDSAAALAARIGHGPAHLDSMPSIIFAAGAIAGALAGGRLAGRLDPRRLSAAFTVLIVIVAGYTLARALPGLR